MAEFELGDIIPVDDGGAPEDEGPCLICTCCGTVDNFRTVRYDYEGDWDCYCNVCGSTELEEDYAQAFHRVLDERNRLLELVEELRCQGYPLPL